ncbi:unnamed protein product [Peronospora destructor]|uniref:Uncharacterized protein n=1 Tax=Peronospora destructor TaxID=86335 RepID=A0AAV0UJ71_9STRA|nr:unnamed protein product [Peronospora destructor]
MAKTTEASATALKTLNGSATSPSESDQHVKTDNKRDLFRKFKLKKAMKKQLDTGQSDNETQEQNFVLQNEEKEEIQAKLYDVSGQYQVIKHQLEAKESELEVAMSKVEAYELELEAQQETTSVKQQKDATMISTLHDKLEKTVIGLSQEEARVLVFQEENNRLTSQVVGMLEDKKQQEREMKRIG